ncbi:MAG TPA: hypothetical protein ENN51_04925 [candidate division WOR-3 bacterium]|uniref:Uncharacterized protein n=1 Tax=candidate division WOR-3 bacterium TaxID=2052148 RepID=A0A7V0T5M0_UNCW3|nr:hypothetical protein [candidate division WOR-3 bacterium]
MALKEREALDRLVARCNEKGIRIAYDDLQTEGGFCRLRDKYIIVINRRAATGTRVRIITDALTQIETDASRPAPVADATPARAEAPALVKTEARP